MTTRTTDYYHIVVQIFIKEQYVVVDGCVREPPFYIVEVVTYCKVIVPCVCCKISLIVFCVRVWEWNVDLFLVLIIDKQRWITAVVFGVFGVEFYIKVVPGTSADNAECPQIADSVSEVVEVVECGGFAQWNTISVDYRPEVVVAHNRSGVFVCDDSVVFSADCDLYVVFCENIPEIVLHQTVENHLLGVSDADKSFDQGVLDDSFLDHLQLDFQIHILL